MAFNIDTIDEFTFQSGDIQISTPRLNEIGLVSFTFQSGDIQISLIILKVVQVIFIYIPIW